VETPESKSVGDGCKNEVKFFRINFIFKNKILMHIWGKQSFIIGTYTDSKPSTYFAQEGGVEYKKYQNYIYCLPYKGNMLVKHLEVVQGNQLNGTV
jgi:hypothetical protein